MKRHLHRLYMSAALALVACAGITARQDVLLPAISGAWPAVRAEAVLGDPKVEPSAAAADAALASGDKTKIAAVGWSALQMAAQAGVAAKVTAGTVSAGVAESLRERQRQFFGGIKVYLER